MSNNIHTPGLVKVDDHSATSATFAIEPLHSGYGMTLGNSLRRVLLSSISGAAVTAFKIEGVTHEFFGMAIIVPEAKAAQAYAADQLKAAFK